MEKWFISLCQEQEEEEEEEEEEGNVEDYQKSSISVMCNSVWYTCTHTPLTSPR